ncbi:hypothetical protein Ancab_037407 [Ancistrocladus abbreviatus]
MNAIAADDGQEELDETSKRMRMRDMAFILGEVASHAFSPIAFGAMVRCLRHRNSVQLLGWCCAHNELVLVFECLPNGSLDKVLHKSCNSITVLMQESDVVPASAQNH